nr:hypothetical protein Iba_chr04aCG15010 [Ipomoea batatas]GMC82437.1 hypothetical protein Iba_chr04bCG13400 [Ipomoea batatas]
MSPLLTAQRIASTAVSPRIANTAATLRLQRTAVAVSLSDSRGLQPSSTFGRLQTPPGNNVEVDQNMMAESPFPDDFVSPPVVLPPRVQADPPLDDSNHGLANLA